MRAGAGAPRDKGLDLVRSALSDARPCFVRRGCSSLWAALPWLVRARLRGLPLRRGARPQAGQRARVFLVRSGRSGSGHP